MKTTCQICGRAIKANTGRIAHHGYTRPGQGWQTRSCFGAGFLPYELACDALPKAIESAEMYRNQQTAACIELIRNPPSSITHDRKDAWGKVLHSETFDRPEGYTFISKPSHQFAGVRGYDWHMNQKVNRHRQEVSGMEDTLAFFRDRLVNWKAPGV
jgi:hypothetical protein